MNPFICVQLSQKPIFFFFTQPSLISFHILKMTVQHTALNPVQYFASVLKEITQAQAIAQHKEWLVFIF